jgi:hypothetical protein
MPKTKLRIHKLGRMMTADVRKQLTEIQLNCKGRPLGCAAARLISGGRGLLAATFGEVASD